VKILAGYRKSEETKRKIIESAAELFAENGYINTTVKNICERSHVSVSRVNYHFHSKAELAEQICEMFLNNLYDAVKTLLENTKEYSLLSEVMRLRCFVHIFHFEDENPYAKFYQELIETGTIGDAFTVVARHMFMRAKGTFYVHQTEGLAANMDLYARTYAGAFTAIVRTDEGQDTQETWTDRKDMFARLFMQLLDIPHDVQDAILKRAKEYDSQLGMEMLSLTEVRMYWR
jgi:AcrR family transcriptional regulator